MKELIAFVELLCKSNLNESKAKILLYLYLKGPKTQKELTEELNMKQTNVSLMISYLLDNKYIIKTKLHTSDVYTVNIDYCFHNL